MNPQISFLTVFLSVAVMAFGQAPTKRYLYMSTPDASQKEGRSGNGILVFDIDNGHKFVRRINVPIFEEGIRGFTGNLKTHSVYYSTSNRRVGTFDLETEKVVWEKTYEVGADRSSITMDGKKLYVPSGWWDKAEDGGLLVVNATNGELIKRIRVGPQAHNSFVSLNGRFVYLGTQTMLTVFDTAKEKLIQQVKDVGEYGIFPYTVNSANSIAYVCLGKTVGFDVVDLKAGKVLHRVIAGSEPILHRTHGAGLTPDATKMPPQPKGHVDLSIAGHGWVTFSLDGKYAYSHAPDIFDAKTKKHLGTFKDEQGNPFASSKFIEVHFQNGKVTGMGNEFGLGRK